MTNHEKRPLPLALFSNVKISVLVALPVNGAAAIVSVLLMNHGSGSLFFLPQAVFLIFFAFPVVHTVVLWGTVKFVGQGHERPLAILLAVALSLPVTWPYPSGPAPLAWIGFVIYGLMCTIPIRRIKEGDGNETTIEYS